MEKTKLKFSGQKDREFYNTLRQRVNQYFETRDIPKYGNGKTVLKTVILFAGYLVPYFLIMTGVVAHAWLAIPLWMIMGLAVAGIGMSIMHDANHGSFSADKRLNRLMGLSLNFLGGNSTLWKLQHNVLHHTYTNIEGVDEDINGRGLLRFSPHQRRRKYHRFQHLYAWFFYSILTLNWVTASDFLRLFRYHEMGLVDKPTLRKELVSIVGWKAFYFGHALVLPLIILPFSAGTIVLGFFLMHFVAGFVLSVIFQTAHVMTDADFPEPVDNRLDNSWAVHQLETTSNYAPNNKLLSWYIGGLNFQIEHHLFTQISHIHYPEISKIVASTAEEFGIDYRSYRTFGAALRDHAKMLKQLGQPEESMGLAVPG